MDHKECLGRVSAYAREHLAAQANHYDNVQHFPRDAIADIADLGILGAVIATEYGGWATPFREYVAINEQIGAACSSARSLLTVHSMVSFSIQRWGSKAQKTCWLPSLACGELIAAFALSEPNVGSDIESIETAAVPRKGGGYLLKGTKTWISFGQDANLLLVFATSPEGPVALVVDRESEGLEVTPLSGMLGTRASNLATITFHGVSVPRDRVLAVPGFGISAVAQSGLMLGRLSVAAGSIGIAGACLEHSLKHAKTRRQFGSPLQEFQLVQRVLTEIYVRTEAARELCAKAAASMQKRSESAIRDVMVAKYYSAKTASFAAANAVHLHGAVGFSEESHVARMVRDAKVMELIEGSNELLEISIGRDL